MATLEHEIRIQAPLEKVWSILNDLEQVAFYNPMVANVRLLSEHRSGIGASRECTFHPKGFARERVIGIDDLKSITMEMYESEWPLEFMNWTSHVIGEAGATTVRTVTRYKVKLGPLGALLDHLVMKRKFKKVLDDLFVSLKNYVETRP